MNAPTPQRSFVDIQPGFTVATGLRPDTILPHQMPLALEWFPGAKLLSLDCFDTLLWRDSHGPNDVFGALGTITPMQRRFADGQARGAAGNTHRRSEVSIGEIYAHLMPQATQARRDAAIAAELDAEARHCFAFAPTVALMRRAKAANMPIILVSDTYLDAAQLRRLIERAAGPEVIAMIDRIFVSNAYGKHKAQGLYQEVLRKLSVRPQDILHIGDNQHADVGGVAPFGVQTLHLKQFDPLLEQQLRLEAACSQMVNPIAGNLTAPQPHRATLAVALPQESDPAARLGMSVLGPVLTGFDMWLEQQAKALASEHGQRVHWLFLMRDGFMPMQVHRARCPDDDAHPIECSRFAAFAASFPQERDVTRYIETSLGTDPEALARQMFVSDADIARICASGDPVTDSIALRNHMRKDSAKRTAVAGSRAIAKRLVAHIRAVCDPAPGDVLMLVDVGYTGTVQDRVDTLLAEALKCHVAGRYLVLREKHHSGLDKAGFIDGTHYDYQALDALSSNATVLDSFCTTDMGSVVDYTEAGEPIRRPNTLPATQAETLRRIQSGILNFVRTQPTVALRDPAGDPAGDQLHLWRQASAAALTRTMFLPLAHEVSLIEHFEHDVNLGTDDTHALFDPASASSGLRQRGLFYLSGQRGYLAGELHGHGLAPKMTFMTHKLFGLDFKFHDFHDRTLDIPVIFIDHQTGALSEHTITATATHDGYFVAAVPLGDCRYSVAVRLAQPYEWVELDSIHAMPVGDFLSNDLLAPRRSIELDCVAEGIEAVTDRLLRCYDKAGFLMVNPPPRVGEEPMMLAVAFRPLADRAD